ncbi:metallopeptidase family protein [Streptomyces sp. NPDC002889]
MVTCILPLSPRISLGPSTTKVSDGCSCMHEIGHHFGIDEERLHALGYG